MKKNTNKKGFTIVELVIVIAVIAILSAVLIPTFGSVIADANAEAAVLAAKNAQTTYLSDIDNVTALGENDLFVYDADTKEWFGANGTEYGKLASAPTLTKGDVVIGLDGVAHSHTAGTKCTVCELTPPAN